MTNLAIDCWRVLAQKGYPQTTRDIYRLIAISSKTAVKEYEVASSLRILQDQGTVRLEDNRWCSVKSPPSSQSISINPEITRNLRTQKTSPSFSRSDVESTDRVVDLNTKTNTRTGRWAEFRRLVDYYVDCLEQTEMPHLRAYFESQNDTWVQLESVIPWDRLNAHEPVGIPHLSPDQAAFQRHRMQRDSEQSMYLGYPVELIESRDGNRWLMPVLSIPVKVNDGDYSMLLTQDGIVQPNKAWVDGKFRNPKNKDAFFTHIGLLPSDDEDDFSGAGQDRRVGVLAEKINRYLGDSFREPLRLDLLSRPDWKVVEPGIYNACMFSVGGRYRFTRSLMSELRFIANKLSDEELDQTALTSLFSHTPSKLKKENENSETILDDSLIAGIDPLNELQESAIRLALNEKLVAITGPPGTGKSAIVRNMMINSALRGKSVLFASKNHRALDAVEKPLNKLVEDGVLVVRTSHQDLALRKPLHLVLRDLLNRPFSGDDSSFFQCLEMLGYLLKVREMHRADLNVLIQQKEQLEAVCLEREQLVCEIPLVWRHDAFGASLKKVLGSLASKELKSFIEIYNLRGLKKWITFFFKRSRLLRARDCCLTIEEKFSDFAKQDDFWHACILWAKSFELERQESLLGSKLKEMPSRNELNNLITQVCEKVQKQVNSATECLAGGARSISQSERQKLSALRSALQTFGQSKLQTGFSEHAASILKLFPLWASTSQSVKSMMPIIPACFDLLIVDEASQCDIASTIPLLVRCKRAVVVGDPMQLQHVTKLQFQTDRELLIAHELTGGDTQRFSYRANSLFDCVRSGIQDSSYVALKEHFRSHPEIAAYASEMFYQSSLIVRTDSQRFEQTGGKWTGMHWHDVSGKIVRPGKGLSGVHAPAEREFIIEALYELEQSGFIGTIGVVSPFAQQKQRLSDEIHQQLNRQFIERVKLHVDTAHGFQGDERDVMFFSLCCSDEMPDGSRNFITNEGNLFNVAITRAKASLRIVGNLEWALNSNIPFIAKCAKYTSERQQYHTNSNFDELYQSPWEKKLHEALTAAKIDAVPQYPVAGRYLDLAVLSPIKLDIEVDGEAYHRTSGGNRKDDDIWRDEQIMSCGWKVCRFWVYQLKEDMDGCVKKISTIIGR